MPVGRTTAGDLKTLPFLPPNAMPAPLLVTYTGGKPVFLKIPSTSGCSNMMLVDGAKPTVVVVDANGPQRRLRWLRNGNWIDAGPKPGEGVIAMGSVLPDGSLLLLLGNDVIGQNYALVRLPVIGGLQNACAACASMPLNDAVQVLRQRAKDDPLARPDPPIGGWRLRGTILVDGAGQLLARPDGDETVIELMQTNVELLRVRLSSPLVLRKDIVVLDAGESKLPVHQLSQP
jgi:hypothetical protein